MVNREPFGEIGLDRAYEIKYWARPRPSWSDLGYHYFEDLAWIEATLNASMILGGMGPVNEVKTFAGKLFASFYALFSGLLFIGAAGLLLAPFAHRLLHIFHLERDSATRNESPET